MHSALDEVCNNFGCLETDVLTRSAWEAVDWPCKYVMSPPVPGNVSVLGTALTGTSGTAETGICGVVGVATG